MTDGREQSPSANPDVGSILGGRFRIVRQIGEGGMGIVLEAENTLTGKRVAIKWMHPQMAAQADAAHRMVREARASARVRHPNVVDVYDVVEETGAIFLVMELLDGEPLTALLERGRTPPHAIIALVLDAMRGVAAAHREGVIHRDVKPDNIFLSREPDRPNPIAKVLDFGISKLTERDALSLTRTGMTLGTPMYMSYEQLAGVRDIDYRADVYAFGVILYEALTGQPPFSAETFSELIIKITTTEAPTPKSLRPELPNALSSIVLKAMARDRNDRTPSLDALIHELEPFSTAEGFHARVTAVDSGAYDATIASPLSSGDVAAYSAGARQTAGQPPKQPTSPVSSATPVTASAARSPSRVSGAGSTPFAQSFDLDDGRISSTSIPRTFTWKSAMVWGGLALAVAAAVMWFSMVPETPHVVAPAPQPQATAQPEAPSAPAALSAPSAPAALSVPTSPSVEAPATAPAATTPVPPAARSGKTAKDPVPAAAAELANPAAAARKRASKKRVSAAEDSSKPAPAPAKQAATLRAGRPRSQDF